MYNVFNVPKYGHRVPLYAFPRLIPEQQNWIKLGVLI